MIFLISSSSAIEPGSGLIDTFKIFFKSRSKPVLSLPVASAILVMRDSRIQVRQVSLQILSLKKLNILVAHLIGNIGHKQGVSPMTVVPVAEVGRNCSHNSCHCRKCSLQAKFSLEMYVWSCCTCPTLRVRPATVGGLTMRSSSLSRTRGRKATRDSRRALPTSFRLATRSPSSSFRIKV